MRIVCECFAAGKRVYERWEIAKYVPKIGQSALSQHLTALKAYGVLNCEKQGQQVIYSIADEKVIRVMAVLYENYCHPDE